jgi:type VI protein secretion system component VasK
MANNNVTTAIDLGSAYIDDIFISKSIIKQIPNMFTAAAFARIINEESPVAVHEATHGNWVLGNNFTANQEPPVLAILLEQLRTTYINNYTDVWEHVLLNIHLTTPQNLAQADALIMRLASPHSPLLQILQTIQQNTDFEPIISASPKLQSIGSLFDKNSESEHLLYQIFTGLHGMHRYLQTVLMANNVNKAAFNVLAQRIQHNNNADAITQLHLIAEQSPEPIKHWLEHISNVTWELLMLDANRYINTSWQKSLTDFPQITIQPIAVALTKKRALLSLHDAQIAEYLLFI